MEVPAFNVSWKDVVGTLYHEMSEFRTDADVRDAIVTGNDDGVLGWMGAQGEIGDQPIAMAGQLGHLQRVFQEVLSSTGNRRVPVQFLYSNAAHGAEGRSTKRTLRREVTSHASSVPSYHRWPGPLLAESDGSFVGDAVDLTVRRFAAFTMAAGSNLRGRALGRFRSGGPPKIAGNGSLLGYVPTSAGEIEDPATTPANRRDTSVRIKTAQLIRTFATQARPCLPFRPSLTSRLALGGGGPKAGTRRRVLTLDQSARCFNFPASENSIELRPKEAGIWLCRRDDEHCREYAVL